MKTQFLTFLLGIFVAISFAATTSNLLTVKPATPKSTVYLEHTSKSTVDKWLSKGYIIKIVAKGDEYYYATVVLEKY